MSEIFSHSYADDAYLIIRSKIIDEDIPFGARLHIGKLAKEMRVSPTPVREALNRLASEGLAEIIPHKGVFITSPCEREVHELCEARLCLELYMAEAVLEKRTEDQLAKLRADQDRAGDAMAIDDFHLHYAEMAGNAIMQDIHAQIHNRLKVLFGRALRISGLSALAQHQEEESRILGALEVGDVDALKRAIQVHIQSIERHVLASGILNCDEPFGG